MSTLEQWHTDAEAEMQDYFGTPIVCTYGRLPLEYAAMYRACAVMDLAQRAVLSVNGEDRLSFLNSLLTAELVQRDGGKPLPAGETRFAFLLERKGRITAEMQVLETGEQTLLVLDARLADAVAKELEKYRFREKAQIARSTLRVMGVFGPESAAALQVLGGPPAGELANGRCAELSGGRVLYRDDLGECVTHYLFAEEDEALRTWKAMVDAGATPGGWAAYNAVRIEAARPLFGVDYDDSFLPAEMGQLERAVSFTKGCYPGQEIVARMRSRDQWARRIALVKLEGEQLPLAGEKVYDADGNEVGAVTSSTISPRLSGIAICLAVLKKAAEGKALRVPAEGALRAAKVSD